MSLLLPGLLSSVYLLGCSPKDGGGASGGGVEVEDEVPTWVLSLTLDAAGTTAGEGVGYALSLVDPAGVLVAVERWSLSSEQESGLLWDPDEVRPTLAGSHTVVAVVEGVATDAAGAPMTVTATATLEVAAGPAYDLDLVLSDASAGAGEGLDWWLQAVDVYGNAASTEGAGVSVDSADVTVESDRLWCTVPGTYLATATLGSLEDVELFVVTPGEPTEIRLTFDDQVELYETRTATVEIWDAYGNLSLEEGWSLAVDGGGKVTQSYRNVTFWEEGWYTVTATVDRSGLSDGVGPFLVDSTGPLITVTSPERGSWDTAGSGTVVGTVIDAWSSGTGVTVNGSSVPVGGDGSFSAAVIYDVGLNILETAAVDGDGNESVDTRAVLSGDFLGYGEPLDDGLVVRLHEGSGGLDTLEELGEGLISSTDLSALIPSPVFSDSSSTKICSFCPTITWYAVDLYVKNPSIGATTLDLDPQSSGTIKATFKVYDPELDWSASGTVTGIGYSGSGDITADSITVTLELTPSVSFLGNINASVSSVSASASNFDFNFNGFGWLESVLSFFGFDVDATVEGYMTDAIEDAVKDAVPDLLEDALQDLELSFDVDVLDNRYTIVAEPDDIAVDATGISLSLETTVDAETWARSEAGLGSLYAGYAPPTWTGSPGGIIAVSDDFLNQVLYALWGGGVLDMSLDSTELGLDPDDLSFILGDVETLTITVDPLLPPVVVPGSSGNLLDLQLGDMHLTLDVDGSSFIEVYVSAITELEVSVDGDQTLSASLGDRLDLSFDVVYPDASSAGAADTEALLSALVPLLLPSLTDALGEIQIPAIEGFTLSSVSVSTGGTDNGFLTLGGSLTQD